MTRGFKDKITGDLEKTLRVAEHLEGIASFWYHRTATAAIQAKRTEMDQKQQAFNSTELLFQLITKEYGGNPSWVQQKRTIEEVKFKGLTEFCTDFMSAAALCPDIDQKDLTFEFARRLKPSYRRVITDDMVIKGLIQEAVGFVLKEAADKKEDRQADERKNKERSKSKDKIKGKAKEKSQDSKDKWCIHHKSATHSTEECRTKKSSSSSSSLHPTSLLSTSSSKDGILWFLTLQMEGTRCQALVDSGATGCFISKTVTDKLQLPVEPSNAIVHWIEGSTCKSLGSTSISFNLAGRQHTVRCTVMNMSHECVLGSPWLLEQKAITDWNAGTMKFKGLSGEINMQKVSVAKTTSTSLIEVISAMQLRDVQPDDEVFLGFGSLSDETTDSEDPKPTIKQDPRVKKVLDQFKDVFPDDLPARLPPKRTVDHKIQLVEGATTPQKLTYRLSTLEQDELRRQLDDLLEKGHIRPSKSPYASPVIFVRKKDGSLRMCVDYRGLNRITVRDRYPLPRIEELLDRLKDAKIFSKLDLRSGYNQVRIEEGDIEKTAFSTRYGLFEFCVLPFGLTNAPATFMRMMNALFEGELDKFVQVFLDDILIFSPNIDEHLKHLQAVLTTLRKHQLFAKLSKCEFGLSSVTYLGHIVSDKGIATDPEKVKAVQEWPPLKNVHEVRQFLGLAGYYQKFIVKFAEIAAPLSDLVREDTTWAWGATQIAAFEGLKKALMSTPVLMVPDPHKDFVVETDASGFAIGAIISQKDEKGHRRVVSFASRKLTGPEGRYPTHTKELLAVHYAFGKFRHYLHGPHVTILTDNESLKYLKTQQHLDNQQAGWLRFLEQFDYEIVYRAGELNDGADALSRSPQYLSATTVQGLDEATIDKFSKGYKKDPFFNKLVQALTRPEDTPHADVISTKHRYKISKSLLYLLDGGNERLCVPDDKKLRSWVLHDCHDALSAGHQGFEKTYALAKSKFYWPNMDTTIKRYVETCNNCQRTKSVTTASQDVLHPLSVPPEIWYSVSMDFITDLPKTASGFDAILVVVDRLSKMIHLIPADTHDTAQDSAKRFLAVIYRYHGLPKDIVSDRDPKFTSIFWRTLSDALGIKLSMSTAYHPQADGQTERTNRTVEQYLRHYVNHQQNDWDELLIHAEYAYNNAVHSSTGLTPFEFCSGRKPQSFPTTSPEIAKKLARVPAAEELFQRFQTLLGIARDRMHHAQEVQAAQANSGARKPRSFQVGDMVRLSTEHYKDNVLGQASPKLTDRYIGPFKIIKKVSEGAFQLELPRKYSRIHPVIPVSSLASFKTADQEEFPDRDPPRPEPMVIDGEEEYSIEEILDHRPKKQGGTPKEYLVKWKGYPREDASWEPAASLENAEALDKYLGL